MRTLATPLQIHMQKQKGMLLVELLLAALLSAFLIHWVGANCFCRPKQFPLAGK